MTVKNITVIELLQQSRAVIANPAHWCQNLDAKTADDEWADSTSKTAAKWCAAGILQKVIAEGSRPWWREDYLTVLDQAETLLDSVAGRLYNGVIVEVNDHDGHEAVLRCYDEAIKEASASQGKKEKV